MEEQKQIVQMLVIDPDDAEVVRQVNFLLLDGWSIMRSQQTHVGKCMLLLRRQTTAEIDSSVRFTLRDNLRGGKTLIDDVRTLP